MRCIEKESGLCISRPEKCDLSYILFTFLTVLPVLRTFLGPEGVWITLKIHSYPKFHIEA